MNLKNKIRGFRERGCVSVFGRVLATHPYLADQLADGRIVDIVRCHVYIGGSEWSGCLSYMGCVKQSMTWASFCCIPLLLLVSWLSSSLYVAGGTLKRRCRRCSVVCL